MNIFGRKTKNIMLGRNYDNYIEKRDTWRITSLVSIFLPSVISLVLSVASESFDAISLFRQGDVIILFYSLTISSLSELFQSHEKNNARSTKGLMLLIALLCMQMSLFGAIKINELDTSWVIILTIITGILSYIACNNALYVMFLNDIKEE